MLSLLASLAISFIPALVGYRFRPGAWFARLRKPGWNPPNWLFAPVWTLLYTIMGIAAWLVWLRQGWSAAIWLYLSQLLLNALWTPLFFGLRSPALGFADIIALWLAIAATLIAFSHASLLASALMLPYLAWVTFATFLNFSIWRLNSYPAPVP
jgi:benzodiazapine receptor